MNIEDIAKKGLVRIIGITSEQKKITISNLARQSNLGHQPTANNIKKLNKMGLVKDYYKGKNRIIEPTFHKITIVFEKNKKSRTIVFKKNYLR